MKTKPLIYLALLLIVLAGLKLMQNSSHDRQVGNTGIESILSGLQASDISRIAIGGPGGDEVVLTRASSGWIVESSFGHPADSAKIDRILSGLGDLNGEFRSDKNSVLADYALDDAQAIHLSLADQSGAARAHLLLGNRLPSGSGFFVRRDGSDKAYAVQGNLLGDLGIYGEKREIESKRFCDMKALALSRDDIDRLTLLQDGETMVLEKVFAEQPADSLPVDRGDFEWQLDGTPVEKSVAGGMAGSLAAVYARDILDPGIDHGFTEMNRRVDVGMADGTVTRVEFGNTVSEPEAGVAMRIAGQSSVYLVPDYLTTRLFKSREELLPEK